MTGKELQQKPIEMSDQIGGQTTFQCVDADFQLSFKVETVCNLSGK